MMEENCPGILQRTAPAPTRKRGYLRSFKWWAGLTPRNRYRRMFMLLLIVYQIINNYDLLGHKTCLYRLSRDFVHQRGPDSHAVSCRALFMGDEEELTKAHNYMTLNKHRTISDSEYMNLTQNCPQFRDHRGYFQTPLSKEEEDFPIAFSILMYKDTAQVERLLRAIYMPQNYYCIHVDKKAKDSVYLAMESITRCFPNVFLSSHRESVFWGHISILNAEMICMSDLVKYNWKYYINLSGQMFPLQTNGNLVKILKIYNGANDIEGTLNRNQPFHGRQQISFKLIEWCRYLFPIPLRKEPAPHNLTIYKGSHQVAATREFIQYALYSKVARDLFDWLKDTAVPDEYFLPMLNHNKHLNAPGGYWGDPDKKVFTARASMWAPNHYQVNWSWEERPCHGKYVRHICILGVGDMQWVYERPELFVNKLFQDFEPLTLDCLEELIYNRTMMQDVSKFIPSYYNNLDIVKNRKFVNTNLTGQ